jgi:malate dehydrogenase (oxaloacetate-decarboxylating)
MSLTPSAQFSLTLRIELPHRSGGTLGKVTATVNRTGGAIVAVDTVEASGDTTLREITVECSSTEHRGQVISAVQAVRGARVVEITDRTFEVHCGGKIHTGLNLPLKTRDDLSMAYTPGVARVCMSIAENRRRSSTRSRRTAWRWSPTAPRCSGSATSAPRRPCPSSSRAMLFKEFADVDAFPICLATKDVGEIVETVKLIAPTFGGINLEDISSPRCFDIEQRLIEEIDIPVFHDDQHGTAIVVLAALINACPLTGRKLEDLTACMVGAGAAGVAVAKILMASGLDSIVACDRFGAIPTGREDYEPGSMNAPETWLAENTNPERRSGTPSEVIAGTDLFVGLSGPGIISAHDLERMNADPFVFAMANPNPEVRPEEAAPHVRVMATGRSDYPNQINNVLAFPGVFRGALDVRGPHHHRRDEDRRGEGNRQRGGRRGARRGLHRPQRVQPRREPGGGARRVRGGRADRRVADERAARGSPPGPGTAGAGRGSRVAAR